MGTKICCEPSHENNNPIEISKLQSIEGPDEPEPSYAYPQNVKYQVPCSINHIFSDIPQLKLDQTLQRGHKKQNSYYLLPYSVYYTGEWKNGRPHGVGDIVFQNGSVLKGTFQKGKAVGEDCILIMDDGSYYRGKIQGNCFCGKGKFVEVSGHVYEGNWDNNLPNGFGVEKFANGDVYQGLYQAGKKKDQKGYYKWANHPQFLQYRGSFQNEYMNGQGTLIKKDGSTISGIFREGSIEDAIIKSKNYQYKGQIRNGILNGFGKLHNIQKNTVYEGMFKDGQPHGHGTIILENGEKKSGNWFKGSLIKDYKGLTDQEVEGCLEMIEEQFDNKIYAEDALESINLRLKANSYQNFVAQLKDRDETSKINGQKYFAVDMGPKTMIISQKN